MASRLRRNSASGHSSDSKVAPLPQPITARHKDSRKAGKIDNQKKRHRHGRNNFGANNTSGFRNEKLRSRAQGSDGFPAVSSKSTAAQAVAP
jgi:hypothetical protein